MARRRAELEAWVTKGSGSLFYLPASASVLHPATNRHLVLPSEGLLSVYDIHPVGVGCEPNGLLAKTVSASQGRE